MLESIRILDLSHRLAGPMATALLAEMGAHVIKVEPPVGDLTREAQPHVLPGVSEYFAIANHSKDVICIDLKKPAGREALLRLVKDSDAILDNYRPGVLDRLGLGDDVLRSVNPRITHVALSGHGATGPYRERGSVDLLVQALSGMMAVTGEPDGPPVPAGISIGDILGALYAAIAVVAGVLARDRGDGAAPSADVSLHHSLIHAMSLWTVRWLNGGPVPPRLGAETPHVSPYNRYPTVDGWIVIAGRGEGYWQKIAAVLGLEPLVSDPRFVTNLQRIRNRYELDRLISDATRHKTTASWVEAFGDLPVAPVNDIAAAFAHPQVVATEMTMTLEGQGARLRVPRSAIRWNGEEAHRRLPGVIGADTAKVLSTMAGYTDEEIRCLAEQEAIVLG